jgi:hypothetical protein
VGRGNGKPKQFRQKKSITKLGGGHILTNRERKIVDEIVAEAIGKFIDPTRVGLYHDVVGRSGY